MLNMVTTIDGATAWEGTSSRLGDDDDRRLFHALRASCDVVLVGAETVRAEGYHPIDLPAEAVARRREVGMDDMPRLAIVSRTLRLDPSAAVFSEPSRPPYLFTGADAPPTPGLAARAEMVVAGEQGVDPGRLLDSLFQRGHQVVLCEGGPTLNGQLIESGLVDEVNLTLSPLLVAGDSYRVARGGVADPMPFYLDRLLLGDRMLFARYLRSPAGE